MYWIPDTVVLRVISTVACKNHQYRQFVLYATIERPIQQLCSKMSDTTLQISNNTVKFTFKIIAFKVEVKLYHCKNSNTIMARERRLIEVILTSEYVEYCALLFLQTLCMLLIFPKFISVLLCCAHFCTSERLSSILKCSLLF